MFGLLAQKKDGDIDLEIGALRYQHERYREFVDRELSTDEHNALLAQSKNEKMKFGDAGTFCNEAVRGTFAKKLSSCKACEFYKQVHTEEGITDLSIASVNISAFRYTGLGKKTNKDRYFIKKLAGIRQIEKGQEQ